MHIIEAILFDPVGSLAEFPSDPFEAIATQMFGRTLAAGVSGSQAYWDVLNLMEAADRLLNAEARAIVEGHEVQAGDRATPYEDATPALAELRRLGISLIAASSLSDAALTRFLNRFSLHDVFADRWSRDTAGGIKSAPLTKAIAARALRPGRVMFLADTASGLQAAQQAGVNAILMMNDPDEAMKLTAHHPAGGIVSLHELPDFVRLVAAENARAVKSP